MNPMWALVALDLLDTLVVLMERGDAAKAEIEATRAQVQEMVAEEREPTPDELRALALKSRLLSIRLKAAREKAARLRPGG